MFGPLDNLVQTFKEVLSDSGFTPAVRVVTEQWEGSITPQIEVVISVGRESGNNTGPVADIYVCPLHDQICEIEVEATLPAHIMQMQAAQLWAKAKEIVGLEVGISGIQRYFRGEAGNAVHIHLESHFIIDYWLEVEVPEEGEASDEDWEQFDTEVAAIAEGLLGLLTLGDEADSET